MNGPDGSPTRLAERESPAKLLLAEVPAAVRATLLRCALPGAFDAECYRTLLATDDGPELAELRADRLVERCSDGNDFRIAPAVREVAWLRWWTEAGRAEGAAVPPALASFGRAYAAWCLEHGRALEAMRGLIVGDPQGAATLLQSEYRTADGALNLTRCNDLLLVLSEPELGPLVGPDLAALRNDLHRYLNARSMWSNAYLAGSRYLHRPAVEEALVGLLDEDGRRTLRLSAQGGMGKSTTLMWFVAHHCVPARIPCALVDLDWVDPVNATRHPWLVLLEIAMQLNLQMAGAPFQELLREHRAYRGALSAQPDDATQIGADALSGPTATSDGQDVEARFHDALVEDPQAVPVLIVIDTVEEAMLRAASEPARLLAALSAVLAAVPQVRLVISGRRTAIEDQYADMLAGLPSGITDFEMPLFTVAEAEDYLTGLRGITDPAVVAATVNRSERLPWQLALCADYVHYNPDITPAEIEQLDPALTWSLDRVIGRVGSPALQWLVRYAVVPRRLRRDMAEAVLMPRVADAMRGSPDDDPDLDVRPRGGVPIFRTGVEPPAGAEGFDALWRELLAYTASSSWVSIRPGDLVVLHPSVVRPLRRLLAERPVYRRLHRDLAAYYERRAAQAVGAQRTEWDCEEVYHRFQLDGPAAGSAWRSKLERAHTDGDVDAVRALAAEVLGTDYLDEDRRPRALPTDPGRCVVDERILATACTELAWALAMTARDEGLAGSHQRWSRIESSLAEARQLDPAEPPPVRWRLARAALLLAHGESDQALELLRSVPEPAAPSADVCRALLESATALESLGRRAESEGFLMRAWAMAEQLGDVATASRIVRALTRVASHEGRYEQAIRWATVAAPMDAGSRRPEPRGEFRGPGSGGDLPAVLLAAGRPATAARLAGDDSVARAVALLELGCPREATALFEDALADDPAPPTQVGILAARAAAELMDLDAALSRLLGVREACFTRQELDGAALCSAEAMRIQLRQVGNVDQAEQYLDEGLRLTLTPGSPGWTELHVGAAELAAHVGDHDRAAAECESVLAALHDADANRSRLLSATVAAMAFGQGPVTAVEQQLARITPTSARLAQLADLTRAVGPARHDLLAGLPAADGPDPLGLPPDPFDEAWASIRLAEVYRMAGSRDAAARLLTAGVQALAPRDAIVWWAWVRGMDRIGPAIPQEPVPPALPPATPPLLLAAYEVTCAHRRFGIDPLGDSVQSERRARRLLDAETRITQWHARLEELAARIAAAEADPERSSRCRSAAQAVRQRLGASVDLPPTSDDHEGREITVHLALRDGLLLVRKGEEPARAGDLELADALGEQDRKSTSSAVARHLVDVLHGSANLASMPDLSGDLFAGVSSDMTVDVRLTVEPSVLAQVPWELLPVGARNLASHPRVGMVYRMPKDKVVARVQGAALQRGLLRAGHDPGPIDGLVGYSTSAAVRAFQRRAGLYPNGVADGTMWRALVERITRLTPSRIPQVLVLAREDYSEVVTQRGWHVSGHDLTSGYSRTRWRVREVRPTEFALLLDQISGVGPVDVLHISATMDTTQTVPHLAIGSAQAASNWDLLPVTLVSRVVQQLAASGSVPLVVLDITAPPRDSELVRQLLARNDFAHQLVGLGQAETVLAAGLADPEAAVQLVEQLTSGNTAAQVAHSLNQRSRTKPGRFSFPRTALFSALRPHMMCPPPLPPG